MDILHGIETLLSGLLLGIMALAVHLSPPTLPPPSLSDTPIVLETPHEEKDTPDASPSPLLFLRTHPEFQKASVLASKESSSATPLSVDSIPLALRESLVNIFCHYSTETHIRTTTGTGFFISDKGIILTNAHVAQFLLLEDNPHRDSDVSCVIRTGEPATPRYKAELLYISPRWVFENSHVITSESPRGTGERDYALLYISDTVDSSPLPALFPALPFSTALLHHGEQHSSISAGGYPAETRLKEGPQAELSPEVTHTTIDTLYTFGSNFADVMSLKGASVGEGGSSGGPVVHHDRGAAIGLIVTKGDTATDAENTLRALTLSYVDRTITEETGFSLEQNMGGDPRTRGLIFKKAMSPFLAEILYEELATPQS